MPFSLCVIHFQFILEPHPVSSCTYVLRYWRNECYFSSFPECFTCPRAINSLLFQGRKWPCHFHPAFQAPGAQQGLGNRSTHTLSASAETHTLYRRRVIRNRCVFLYLSLLAPWPCSCPAWHAMVMQNIKDCLTAFRNHRYE